MNQSKDGDFSWLQLPAIRENLPSIHEFVLNKARSSSVPGSVLQKMDLVLEELLLNIINYAYPEGQAGSIQLGCCYYDSGEFHIRIMDSGVAFNPLSQRAPDVNLSVQDRDIGGLGIHLVRNMADQVDYQRKDAMNILDIVFKK